MALLPRAEFERLLRRRSREELAAFVAALWAARGWEVERDGREFVAAREGRGERRRVRVGADGEADVFVVARRSRRAEERAREAGADLVGPGELYAMAGYGIDRETCDALFETHLGVGATRERGADPGGRTVWRGVAVVAVLAVAVVASAVAGPVSGPGGEPTAAATPTATPAATGDARGPFHAAAEGETVYPEQAATAAGTYVTSAGQPVREPNCAWGPRSVVKIQVDALRNNDPRVDNGVRTVWNYLAADRRWEFGSFAAFREHITAEPYRPLRRATRVEFGGGSRNGTRFSQRVMALTDERWATYTVRLRRTDTDPERTGCWVVESLTPTAEKPEDRG